MRPRDENKEEAIRHHAIQMIVNDGFDGLSMQKLAKAAGVSPATIYIYFKDRDDLIMNIAGKLSGELFERITRGFDPEMHFAEGLWIQWQNRVDYNLKHPLEMEFLELLRHSHLYTRLEDSIMKGFGKVMGQFMHNALQRKELVEIPFEAYWAIAYAPLYQLIKFHSQKRSHVNAEFALTEDILRKTFDLAIKALTP